MCPCVGASMRPSIRLSDRPTDRMYVCMCVYVCMIVCVCVYACVRVCPNEGLIGILCACCETCQTILAPESWKCVNVQKVSQTNGIVPGGS